MRDAIRSGPNAVAARWLVGVGLAVVTFGTIVPAIGSGGAGAIAFLVPFLAWSMLPYLVLWIGARWVRDAWVQVFAVLALVAADIWIRIELFVFPRGSTDSLALLFTPIYWLLSVVPAGALIGWLWAWLWPRGPFVRACLVIAFGSLAGLALIARARPGWLPAPVARSVSAEHRIGPARIVAGGDRFELQTVTDRGAWFQAGDFDPAPGDEIAVVGAGGARLLNGPSGEQAMLLAMSPEAVRRWSWFSQLARVGASWAIVQTGGGFSRVEVVDADGSTRWSFLPEVSPPPVALLPRDLDRDGRTEFYAASGRTLYRLDDSGATEWQRDTGVLVDHLDAAISNEVGPGAVLATSANGDATLWSPGGDRLASPALPRAAYLQSLVVWKRGLALVSPEDGVCVRDLEGQLLLGTSLGDFQLANAVTFRAQAADEPLLAVAASAGRRVERHRLMVLGSRGERLYDQILDTAVHVLVRRGPPSTADELMVSGQGLQRLVPRN